jgi:hypothetical protein
MFHGNAASARMPREPRKCAGQAEGRSQTLLSNTPGTLYVAPCRANQLPSTYDTGTLHLACLCQATPGGYRTRALAKLLRATYVISGGTSSSYLFCRRTDLRSIPSRMSISVEYVISTLFWLFASGKRNVPFWSCLYQTTYPSRSQASILSLSPRLFRKTNKSPHSGLPPMKTLTRWHSPLNEHRMSAACRQKKIRTWLAIGVSICWSPPGQSAGSYSVSYLPAP